MSSAITDSPAVKQLIDTFDLEVPQSYRGVITDWSFVEGKIDGDFLIIKAIDIYDTNNNFIKTADMSVLKDNIHLFSFVFRKNE